LDHKNPIHGKRQALSADKSDIVEPSGALKQAQAVQNETYFDSPEARALFYQKTTHGMMERSIII
jgi:hypothetical protein